MRIKSGLDIFCFFVGCGTLLVVLGIAGNGCRPRENGDRPIRPEPERIFLSLFCGAALRPLAEGLAAEYQRRTGIGVKMTYGGSNLLMGQLELVPGEADLFLPGDAWYVEAAAERGWIEEIIPLTHLWPAILVQEGNPLRIRTLRDLVRPGVRLAMPDSRGPALARLVPDLLAAAGLSESEMVPRIVFTAATLPELAHAVRLGHADAALMWEFFARLQSPCETVSISPAHNQAVLLSIGIMRASQRKEESRHFVEFMKSPAARPIWQEYHFTPPSETQR